jgi:hypothetical protein
MKLYIIYAIIYLIGAAIITFEVADVAAVRSLSFPSMWIISLCLGFLGLVWGIYEMHNRLTVK